MIMGVKIYIIYCKQVYIFVWHFIQKILFTEWRNRPDRSVIISDLPIINGRTIRFFGILSDMGFILSVLDYV